MIRQHDATRLHWDLRLEHDGVLRSWALPRGVPWNPKENRFAVATEDHGLEFLDETIDTVGRDDADPGYGAGRLTTWDRGTYETHKWRDDEVIVTLAGTRVSGKYAMFSMRGTRDWLIHRMDPPVDEARVPLAFGIVPMRATAGELPDQNGWVYEPRWHGIRALVTDDNGRVVITDDTGADISLKFPEIRRIGRALGHRELILDGVIVPVDPSPDGSGSGAVRHDRRGLAWRLRIRSDSGARNAARTARAKASCGSGAGIDGIRLPERERGLKTRAPCAGSPAIRRARHPAPALRAPAARSLPPGNPAPRRSPCDG